VLQAYLWISFFGTAYANVVPCRRRKALPKVPVKKKIEWVKMGHFWGIYF